MLEKARQIAEQAATNVSRRQFLGQFGRTAAGAAAAMGMLLAFPGPTLAGRKPKVSCGPQSHTYCIGKHVGDRCLGRTGRCALYDGSETDCNCVIKGRGGGGGRPR